MNKSLNAKTIISAWWLIQGLVFIDAFVIAVTRQGKPLIWASTFSLILCSAAILRHKGKQLKRIADMVLLAYSISFAVIAWLLTNVVQQQWLPTLLTATAVVNLALSLTSVIKRSE